MGISASFSVVGGGADEELGLAFEEGEEDEDAGTLAGCFPPENKRRILLEENVTIGRHYGDLSHAKPKASESKSHE